ncbi:MAG: nitrous oxide-stimulated promoter family protein [Planctomycetes bacterium]|jgi:hypothetical protein|nr:nitrous oxide-stimulated promoter family protein [Planctomycetota bacterium]
MFASPGHLRQIGKDLRVLGLFVETYCRKHHRDVPREAFRMGALDLSPTGLGRREVCAECRKLLSHAVAKRARCPLEPKPSCRLCPVHCYAPVYRQRIREVMKFSGRHLILRGRLHLLLHFLERRPKGIRYRNGSGPVPREAGPENEKSGPATGARVQ